MSLIYSIYSTAYLEEDVSNYNCYLNETEYITVTNENPSSRLFARISNKEKEWYVALGQPVQTSFNNDKTLFVPNWILEQISVLGDGTGFNVEWVPVEFFENSTHISLKAVDSNYESSTIEDELSIELSKLGILQRGTKIHISMPSLDSYTIVYEVIDVEPTSIVLCQGDDVSLEFINDAPLIPVIARPPTPYPDVPELLLPPSAPIIESNELVDQSSNTLNEQKPKERYNPWRSKDFKPSFS